MPELSISQYLVLFFFAFLAGFVDSIVGGGGLIQLPMLMIALPNVPLATAFGTNKMVAVTGTLVAVRQYATRIKIDWRTVLVCALAAFIFSFIGARVVTGLHPDDLRPVVIVLLIAIAVYIFFRKDFGEVQASRLSPGWQRAAGILAGAAIGFYDGFFGPGTGSFLIFVFISVFGMSFLYATASAKVVNAATNLAALLYFAFSGHVLYQVALPMAVFNILGALAGTRLAMLKGNRFVRVFFLVVVLGIIAKLVTDTYF